MPKLLSAEAASSSNSLASNFQFIGHNGFSLATVPLHMLSQPPLFKWLAKFNWGMTTYRETFPPVSAHILLLPFPFFLWVLKIPQGRLTTTTGVIYLSPILNTAFSGVSTCQAFILCIPVPGTGHGWFPQCCWMQNGCILAFHSCTVISSMMSTWDFRICLIPHK